MYFVAFQTAVLPRSPSLSSQPDYLHRRQLFATPLRRTAGENIYIRIAPIISQQGLEVTRNSSLTAPARAAKAASGLKLSPPHHHFLHVDDLSSDEINHILNEAIRLKGIDALNDLDYKPLSGKAMSMIFAKPSARTRISFETAMYKSGGHSLCLGSEIGINTREAAKDISRVLSGMTDMIMARLYKHDDIVELAEYSTVPIINGLTDYNHPCQIMADAMTIMEDADDGQVQGKKIVYIGDGNNIVHSWFELLARVEGMEFVCCCPENEKYLPDMKLYKKTKEVSKSSVFISHDPKEAIQKADYVYTDVWASMGDPDKQRIEQRLKDFQPFQITDHLMQQSKHPKTGRTAKFLHCLPAERGRECTDEVMEADYSLVFEQAANRMHAQLAIMLSCMGWPSST